MRKRPLRPNAPRRGLLLLAVLVCLIVVGLILIGALTHGMKLRRQMKNERTLEQTRWVLDAGISRAITMLKTNPNYTGEAIELKQPLREHKARLKIRVGRDPADKPILVEVIAALERVEKTAADNSYQRSLRFEFLSQD